MLDIKFIRENPDAVKSAQSVGIVTFNYDKDRRDLTSLKKFIDRNL